MKSLLVCRKKAMQNCIKMLDHKIRNSIHMYIQTHARTFDPMRDVVTKIDLMQWWCHSNILTSGPMPIRIRWINPRCTLSQCKDHFNAMVISFRYFGPIPIHVRWFWSTVSWVQWWRHSHMQIFGPMPCHKTHPHTILWGPPILDLYLSINTNPWIEMPKFH